MATPYFCLDVETMAPPAEVLTRLEEEFLAEWEAPGNIKDLAKLAAKRQADLEKFREKAALLDEAPIAMAGVMLQGETYLLHGVKIAKAKWFGRRENNVLIEGFAGERALMEALITVLDEKVTRDALGVGHNVFRFDLPKIRLACIRNGLKLPESLRVLLVDGEDRQKFTDTMHVFCRYFARNGEIFVSQDKMLGRLGIESWLKGVATGADVPGLLASGKINEVATKLLADLLGVRDAFLKMTGR
jgi:hypothetical protein